MIAVTGGGGEIGSWLVQLLIQRGENLRVIHRSNLTPRLSRFQLDFRKVDLGDADSIQNAIEGCDIVVNCVVDKLVHTKVRQRVNINVNACENLVRACIKNKVKRLIHLSSIVVLPPRVTMNVAYNPYERSTEKDWYTLAKIATELKILDAQDKFEVCVVRPGIVYGAYMAWSRVVLSRCENFKIYLPHLEESASRCYAVHVSDLAELIYTCVTHDEKLPKLIMAVNPERISWHNFYEQHASAAGIYNCIETLPLDELNRHANLNRDNLISRIIYWIYASPLLDPIRNSKGFGNMVEWTKTYLLDRASANKNTSISSNSNQIQRLWPSRFELGMYLSEGEFNHQQSGGDVGFYYQVNLLDGCRNATDWWRYRLDAFLKTETDLFRSCLKTQNLENRV